jgi:hypothetical protein
VFKVYFLLFSVVISVFSINYGDLDSTKFPKWHESKVDFPNSEWDTINVSTLGILPNNSLSDSIAMKLMTAIKDKGEQKRVFFFPEGTYNFEQPILIGPDGNKDGWGADGGAAFGVRANDFVIMGAGSDKTKFLFDCDVKYFKALIWIENNSGYSARNNSREVNATPVTGDSIVAIQYNWDLNVGDMLCIKQDNDDRLMVPEADSNQAWYIKYNDPNNTYLTDFAESFGQFVRVVAKNENGTTNTVTVSPKIGLDFTDSLTPRASVYLDKSISKNIGIEGIYIEHVIDDSKYTPGGTNDIFDIAIRFAKDIYVRDVESYNTARGHIIVEYANNVLIDNSKFSYARNYGVGGAGYGVCVQNRSSEVTIENNEFIHLRHAVVLKEGANHNVIAYNVSRDWAIIDPEVGISAEADFSVHGMYSHNNLFEGNVVHNIYYADYWGPTGPRTTAFRNRTYGDTAVEGIYVDDFSHYSNVIANEILGKGQLGTDGTSENLYFELNRINGVISSNNLSEGATLPPSLYLDSKPSFWIDTLAWPAFGYDVVGSETNKIPVTINDEVSIEQQYGLVNSAKEKSVNLSIKSNGILVSSKTVGTVRVVNISGRVVEVHKDFKSGVVGKRLTRGVYFLTFIDGNKVVSKSKILIK